MTTQEADKKQSLLLEELRELSLSIKSEMGIADAYDKLSNIYSGGFRHRYADFFPLVVEIGKSSEIEMDFDCLTTNLFALLNYAVERQESENKTEVKELANSIGKLCDHLNLEIARYHQYSEVLQPSPSAKQFETLSRVVNSIVSDVNKIKPDLDIVKKEVKETVNQAKSRLSSVQIDLITVLGIFAAIILAFSGSITILGNALSGIQNAPFYKTVFFVLLCGFVLLNTIFLLLYIVSKIVDKNILTRCSKKGEECKDKKGEEEKCTNSDKCDCKDEYGYPKCGFLTMLRCRMPYVFWINVIFLILMAIDIFMWIVYPQLNCDFLV